MIGVTKNCTKPELVYDFFRWLYSDFLAPVFALLGGLSPCISAYDNRDVNDKYPWLSSARRSFSIARRRNGSDYYENFSEMKLESILGACVQKAVLGKETPEQAIRRAQEECERLFSAKAPK